MQTRIIKHTRLEEVWYTIEYKRLLFWRTLTDFYDCDCYYYDLERAIEDALKLSAKETKEVVK